MADREMTTLPLDALGGRTAGEVVHAKLSSTPATATVGEIRAFFAASTSRRLAVLVDADGRYVGALGPDDLPADAGDDAPVAPFARRDPFVLADADAGEAAALAAELPSNRLPVVDADGRLVGVLALDRTRTSVCGLRA